ILRGCGLPNKSGNYGTLHSRIQAESLDISHIPLGSANHNRPHRGGPVALPLEKVMVENSTYPRHRLKKRLLKEGILKNECAICGLLPIWNGEPLVLRLDHENGVSDDNRHENLRLVCPNCDSQLPTFAGRNIMGGLRVIGNNHGMRVKGLKIECGLQAKGLKICSLKENQDV